MPKKQSAEEIRLVPFEVFQQNAKRIFSNTKKESDCTLERFQASNARKRIAKKEKAMRRGV